MCACIANKANTRTAADAFAASAFAFLFDPLGGMEKKTTLWDEATHRTGGSRLDTSKKNQGKLQTGL